MKKFIKKYILEVLLISSFMIIGLGWSIFTQNQFIHTVIDEQTIAYNTFDTAQLLPKSDFDIKITIH
jgi:hypothetical protein